MIYSKTYKIHDDEMLPNSYALRIPKAWARGEADSRPTNTDDVEQIPHYELRIVRQIGTFANRRGSYILFKLPKSGKYIHIIIHPDSGVSFDKSFHTLLIRETDELDRRIVLGFCKKYSNSIKHSSYEDRENGYLQSCALCYRASDMPKRIKQGPYGWSTVLSPLKPYDEIANYNNSREQGMFSGVVFLNT